MADEANTPDPSEEAQEVVLGEIVRSKAEEAYEMRLSGKSPSEIADALGYTSGGEAAQAIAMKMKSDATHLTGEDRLTILKMEMDRLDRIRSVHWQAAMIGDLHSAEILLKIHDRVVKITGLDSIDTATQTQNVLVIGGQEHDFVQKLKELADDN